MSAGSSESRAEAADADAPLSRRERIRLNPTANRLYRAGVGVVGGTTIAVGFVLMPLPGPGTLIAIGGLGVLATEFTGARKLSKKVNTTAKKAIDAAKDAHARRVESKRESRADGT
tara:strand:+ start:182 stop:529 length:348 start_codon:yes stop_codon:yes gene_type:complete